MSIAIKLYVAGLFQTGQPNRRPEPGRGRGNPQGPHTLRRPNTTKVDKKPGYTRGKLAAIS